MGEYVSCTTTDAKYLGELVYVNDNSIGIQTKDDLVTILMSDIKDAL